MHSRGQGAPLDYGEAVKWSRLAAEQGVAEAQFLLGMMCQDGLGVSRDYVMAYMWYSLAASTMSGQLAALASKSRDGVGATMIPTQIAEAQRLAREWKPKTWEELKPE